MASRTPLREQLAWHSHLANHHTEKYRQSYHSPLSECYLYLYCQLPFSLTTLSFYREPSPKSIGSTEHSGTSGFFRPAFQHSQDIGAASHARTMIHTCAVVQTWMPSMLHGPHLPDILFCSAVRWVHDSAHNFGVSADNQCFIWCICVNSYSTMIHCRLWNMSSLPQYITVILKLPWVRRLEEKFLFKDTV